MSVKRDGAVVLENVEPALGSIASEDVSAIVDEDVADPASSLAFRSLGKKGGDLLGGEGIADVVDPQPGAEPGSDGGVDELSATRNSGLGDVEDVKTSGLQSQLLSLLGDQEKVTVDGQRVGSAVGMFGRQLPEELRRGGVGDIEDREGPR